MITEVLEKCSNCGGKIDPMLIYTCPRCGEVLCENCDCLCDDLKKPLEEVFEEDIKKEITRFEDGHTEKLPKGSPFTEIDFPNPLIKGVMKVSENMLEDLSTKEARRLKEHFNDIANGRDEKEGLIEGVDLNLYEVGTLLENISLDYHTTPIGNTVEKERLFKLYNQMAKHYNKVIGGHVITEHL